MDSRRHGLYPPKWLAALYHAFAAPYMLLALLISVAPFVVNASWRHVPSLLLYLEADPLRMWVMSGLIVAILVCGVAAFATIFIFGLQARAEQRRRNALLVTAPPPDTDGFVLYLRPFREDQRSRITNPFSGATAFMYGARIRLEIFLALVLHPEHRLIAVGDKHRTLGAEKLKVEDANWFNAMQQLAHKAEAIIIVPGYRGATAQEIDFLFATPVLLRKTIFVQPACDTEDQQWSDWIEYMAAAKTRNVPLPDPAKSGQVFFQDADGDTISVPLRHLDESAMRILVWRAARAQMSTHGLIDEEPATAPSDWGGFRLLDKIVRAPRAFIAPAMLVIAGAAALASMAAWATQMEYNRQRASGGFMEQYRTCLARITSPLDAVTIRDACLAHRQEAELQAAQNAPIPFARAQDLISAGNLAEAESVLRLAFVKASPTAQADGAGGMTDFTETLLRSGLNDVFPPVRNAEPPLDADSFWHMNNPIDEGVNPFLGEGTQHPALREFLADEAGVSYLREAACPTLQCMPYPPFAQEARVRDHASNVAKAHGMLAVAYESSGAAVEAQLRRRRALVTLLWLAGTTPADEEIETALSDAVGHVAQDMSLPWERIALHLQLAQSEGRLSEASDATIARARALAATSEH